MTATNRAPIKIKEDAQHIVTEDILELVNAGIIKTTVVDHHIAEAWAKILPDIVIRKDLKIHTGGKIAWAARKENPKLLASLNAFIRRHKKGSLVGNVLFKRYYQDSKWINNPNSGKERDKLTKLRDLLQRFGKQYAFTARRLRPVPVEYFEAGQEAAALRWLDST
jgi:membrane-bound lytic murein transglycosylase MltF